ncbi:YdiU family protein [Winogradskyella sp.]|uniref:protein adenylyltransferase SelO n=1 Tax=Winogradskyella sp. TaxID=1883156 RepID=UPI0025E00DFC|nr:YdiU family protein [Winogradskyella sp.]
MNLKIKSNFTEELPGDPIKTNTRRQVNEACFSYVTPKKTTNPKLIHVATDFSKDLGFTNEDLKSKDFINIVTGNKVLEKTNPYAMCYGGHQFGRWAGQLGDGRAINLFDVNHNNKQWTIQLKGAGETPYSRSGDGLAVLRSSIREYLCSEAMHHLGVPTTRALSLALSGDQVMRDMLYDGNQAYEKGAIVSRVSPSFLRFGNFEIFSARGDHKNLKSLVHYTIKHHFSHLGKPSKDTYILFFDQVMQRTLDMIIHWQRVGFVHGVMNTDNMSILGLTIDYGPYGWLEGFDFGWTPNTTDAQNKRYRFANQPNIGLWNLYQLANALYPLIEDAEPLEKILENYKNGFETKSLTMMKSKLGLFEDDAKDQQFIQALEDILQLTETDMTIFFRLLSNFNKDNSIKGLEVVNDAFYKPHEVADTIAKQWGDWFNRYSFRLEKEKLSDLERKTKMDLINPKYVLRNYMAQLAIDDANNGNYDLIDALFQLLKNPYAEQPKNIKWFAKRPEWARHKVGCSMLSCSS